MNATATPSNAVVAISQLSKRYASGLEALKNVSLEIARGEIFALLGPNGAGKTTLINIVCGIVNRTTGTVIVDGSDTATQARLARAKIGLVPQELATDTFETVWATVNLSRGLFGLPPDPAHIEKVLKELSLWEKRNSKMMQLSGGMKRRVLIAKALSHQPKVLFLDEPSAGVDVELRRDMWRVVRALRDDGTTIILTTHYIEEAEELADRIGVIAKGEIVLVEEKTELMRKLGQKKLTLQLQQPLSEVPPSLAPYKLALNAHGQELVFTYETARASGERTGITSLLNDCREAGVTFKDLQTKQSSLEEIFVNLVKQHR